METYEVGELVIISGRYGIHTDVIKNITKAGNYKTEKSGVFTEDGFKRGGDTWHKKYLKKYDKSLVQHQIEKNKKRKLIEEIRNIDLNVYTSDALQKIKHFIDDLGLSDKLKEIK